MKNSYPEHERPSGPDTSMISGSKGDSRPKKYAETNPSTNKETGHAGSQSIRGGARLLPNPTQGGHKDQKSGSCGG